MKYYALGLEYPLTGVPQVSREKAAWAEYVIKEAMKEEI